MQIRKWIIIVFFVGILPCVLSDMGQIDFPLPFARCLNTFHHKTTLRGSQGLSILSKCSQDLRWKTSRYRQYPGKNNTDTGVQYCNSLINKIKNRKAGRRPPKRRGKRQADVISEDTWVDYRRERYEIRMMSPEMRYRYFSALNILKDPLVSVRFRG